MKFFLINYLFIVTALSYAFPQSLKSFRPFDWVLYKGSGTINAFTEGYTFVYIGTSLGGIKRFNNETNAV